MLHHRQMPGPCQRNPPNFVVAEGACHSHVDNGCARFVDMGGGRGS